MLFQLGPGQIKDYKLLLQLCENLKDYGNNIVLISRDVLDWIYPLCKEALDKGVNVDATEFIVKYYEKHLMKQPDDETPIKEVVINPPSKTPLTETPLTETPLTKTPLTKTPVIKKTKKKIEKEPKRDKFIPQDNKRFTYLRTYKSINELRKYCKSHGIDIKTEYNMEHIKEVIMEFYKDTDELDIPWN